MNRENQLHKMRRYLQGIGLVVGFILVVLFNWWQSEIVRTVSRSNQLVPETLPSHASHKIPRPEDRRVIPLTELTRSHDVFTCPEGQVFVPDTVLDPRLAWEGGRKIPRIVHVTARSRCMAPEFAEVLEKWRFDGYSLLFHDDDAMQLLLDREWAEFPALQGFLRCVKYGGAMKADIWRLLVMWEYGGVYTDIDNRPNKFDGETLLPTDEAFFQVDRSRLPSQWFFAAMPRHPLINYSIQEVLVGLSRLKDVGKPQIVWTTGPGALKGGIEEFAKIEGGRVQAGVYVGRFGHTVKIVGDKQNQNEWVERSVWKDNRKAAIMKESNMTHLTKMVLKETNTSCLETLYDLDKGWSFSEPQALYW